MNAEFKYKNEVKLEERKREADRIINQYPNRMPVICEYLQVTLQCQDFWYFPHLKAL